MSGLVPEAAVLFDLDGTLADTTGTAIELSVKCQKV